MLSWLKTHSLIWILFIAFLLTFDWLVLNKKKLNAKWYAALIISVIHVFIGVACVKFFALLEAGFDMEKAGNMSLFGAVFLMPLWYWIGAKVTKRQTAAVFDVFVIAMVATLLCARINCFISGCCLGKCIGSSEARWPTKEAEVLFYIVFLVIMTPRVFKGKGNGRVYPVYMVTYGAFRFINEFFRESEVAVGVFHLSHAWALLSALIGVAALLIMKRGRTPNDHRASKNANPQRRK